MTDDDDDDDDMTISKAP